MSAFEDGVIQRALELRELSVREVMVPRNDIVSVSVEASLDYVLRTLIENQYTRVPVFEASPENIVGILHAKICFQSGSVRFWLRA